jgi:uncharacterized membrane protein
MDTATQIHVTSAAAALGLGAWQIVAAKRGLRHRGVGYAWVAAMLVTALSSFWLTSALGFAWLGGLGPIHGLSLFTLVSLALAVRFAIRRDFRQHRNWVAGAFAGLVGAGVFAVAVPGRQLNTLLLVDLPRLLGEQLGQRLSALL